MSIAKGITLITGSAQGIGRSIALRLARDGFDIALNDLPSKRDQLDMVAKDIIKIGRRTHLVPADVSIESDVKGMVRGVTEELGGLDVMVANAGVGSLTELISTELDEWERVMAINARGVFLCYKHAAAQMVTQGRGGRIIGASSVAGKESLPVTAAYSASKFAVRSLTQTAALELARYNITVNSYAPGLIHTALAEAAMKPGGDFEKLDQELAKRCIDILTRLSLKYAGQAEDVANVVSFLASKEAHFVTGQSITVDGGRLLS